MPSPRADRARVVAELAAARQRLADLEQEQGYASFALGWSRRPEDVAVEIARAEADIAELEERLAEIDATPANDVAAPAPASPPERAPAPAAEYLDTREAAALLGVSVKTLEGLRRRGGGPPFVRVGKVVRYRRAELERTVQGTVQENRPTRR